MRVHHLVGLTLCLIGTVTTISFLTEGYPEEITMDKVERMQLCVGMCCMIGLLSWGGEFASRLKNTNLKTILQYGCLVGTMAVIAFIFPEIRENPNGLRGATMFVALIGMLILVFGGQYILDRKRRKENPDGFFLSFGKAMHEARHGAVCESETGKTIGLGADGHIRFEEPLESADAESMWRIIQDAPTEGVEA